MGIRTALVTAAVVALVAGPASADTTASITALSASVSGESIAVTGKAAFSRTELQVSTDGSGDGRAPGSDITGASITETAPGKLTFTIKLADSAQPTPEVLSYNWLFHVTAPNGSSAPYWLKSSRTSYGQAQSGDPNFELWSNPDENGIYSTVAPLQGSFTSTSASWVVDSTALPLPAGTILTPQSGTAISTRGGASVGAPGVGSAGTAPINFDTAYSDEYEVMSATVQLGVAPAGTPTEEIPLTGSATLRSNGSIIGSLPRPATAGSYVVVARGCADGVCSVATADVVVP